MPCRSGERTSGRPYFFSFLCSAAACLQFDVGRHKGTNPAFAGSKKERGNERPGQGSAGELRVKSIEGVETGALLASNVRDLARVSKACCSDQFLAIKQIYQRDGSFDQL